MFTRSGLHAIRAMTVLARLEGGAYGGTHHIASSGSIPPSYVSKVLQALVRAGLVESHKGPGGGFRLARPAERITLWETVAPFDGLSQRGGCVLGLSECSEKHPCALHDDWKDIRGKYLETMRRTTLAELNASSTNSPIRDFLTMRVGAE
ncbi:MAG: Rrf2 family transcriptional regulator [Planctomycetota bacterium]|nr:Rrf2 family transcriptional regulator [Planctomycetaceae bacterium]MDQ3330194.1 Rrf2 family transcriptional regulator [Planctomycetota bacterium]